MTAIGAAVMIYAITATHCTWEGARGDTFSHVLPECPRSTCPTALTTVAVASPCRTAALAPGRNKQHARETSDDARVQSAVMLSQANRTSSSKAACFPLVCNRAAPPPLLASTLLPGDAALLLPSAACRILCKVPPTNDEKPAPPSRLSALLWVAWLFECVSISAPKLECLCRAPEAFPVRLYVCIVSDK